MKAKFLKDFGITYKKGDLVEYRNSTRGKMINNVILFNEYQFEEYLIDIQKERKLKIMKLNYD